MKRDVAQNILSKLLVAFPWAATKQGHTWWEGRFKTHAKAAGLELVPQPESFTGFDIEALDFLGSDQTFWNEFLSRHEPALEIIQHYHNVFNDDWSEEERLLGLIVHAIGESEDSLFSYIHARSPFNEDGSRALAKWVKHALRNGGWSAEGNQKSAQAAVTTPLTAAEGQILGLIRQALMDGVVLREELPELVRQHSQIGIAQVEVSLKDGPTVVLENGPYQEAFPLILQCVAARQNVAVIGPAGSGKTTIASQVAQALGLDFYFTGAIQSEYKLLGFVDAHSGYKRTTFRDAYENGGVFLFDEIDASAPQALLAFNAALANGECDFPDGMVKRHKNFVAIAAGNTFWSGRDRVYVGRNQLDAASMDRFMFVEMGYDQGLERQIAGNSTWTDYVQDARRAAADLGIRHVISPRASVAGSKLFEQGVDGETVAKLNLWKGLPEAEITKIKGRMAQEGELPQQLVRTRTGETPTQTVQRVKEARCGVNLLAMSAVA